MTSTLPSASPRGPTSTCQGTPIRSAVANLAPGPLVEVVIEHVDALGRQRAVELLAGGVGVGAALLEIEDRDLERRHRLRPFDAGLVVERLDDRADQARHADAVGAAVDRTLDAVRARVTTAFIGTEYLVPK